LARILIVDDDSHIRDVVRFALAQTGFQVVEAKDGRAALDAFAAHPADLVILDILMPELDGVEVCKTLRRRSQVPILFLSSRDDEVDRVVGLELGADDYVTKPFSPRELVARVKALLRRAAPDGGSARGVVAHGELRLDLDRHQCSWGAQPITLTVAEFGLLTALARAPGRAFSRQEIIEAAFGDGYVITERTIDSHVRRIRKKLKDVGADPVETVYGVGYRLREAS
jgi:two-component system, OmpR family, response regulator